MSLKVTGGIASICWYDQEELLWWSDNWDLSKWKPAMQMHGGKVTGTFQVQWPWSRNELGSSEDNKGSHFCWSDLKEWKTIKSRGESK